jgi:hypothetical protein
MMENVTSGMVPPPMGSEVTERMWKPSRIEALRYHEVSIKFLNRGVVVTVGCKQIAYESIETFMTAFNNYVERPYDVQETWRKSFDEQDQIK